MALSAYRLRRSAAILPRLLHRQLTAVSVPSYSPLPQAKSASTTPIGHQASRSHRMIQFASFRSSAPLADRRSDSGENKISPDEILFEGCDFNHWLITMDFPKDPKPTPEQMVETYVETLAKVVGSREEAMKRMYACSTTTYTGFQAVMTEEMSEKFRGLPGVVFILPDSYIDPVNKEYGGDKYEMGKITHRPPPVQYGRQGRYGDRNRNYDRPRYDRSRDSSPMQGNQPYSRPGPMQGDGRNFAPQQNYNPMGQQNNPSYDRQGLMQGPGTNYTPQQTYTPVGQQGCPPYSHQGSMNNDSRNYAPNQSYGAPNQSYGAAGGRDNYRPENRDTTPPYRGDFNQGGHGNFTSQGQSGFSQGQERYGGNTASFGRDQYNQGANYPGPAGQSFNSEAQTNFNSPGNLGNGQGRH